MKHFILQSPNNTHLHAQEIHRTKDDVEVKQDEWVGQSVLDPVEYMVEHSREDNDNPSWGGDEELSH